MESNFDYYELKTKLIRPQLGTCSEASIFDQHVLKKAQSQIKLANKLTKKVSKSLEKFKGVEISENKEIKELQGILRAYQALIGKKEELPEDHKELLEVAKEYELEFEELIAEGSQKRATVFLRDKDGWPLISSHMFIGFFKEAAKISCNNGDKRFMKTKVSVSEVFTMDVKVVEDFIRPSKDIIRDEKGERLLLERAIRFERLGQTVTAIAISEQLPIDTELKCVLRVRKNSPITEEYLNFLLDMGKNLGLGAWRSSGNMGAFVYQLRSLPEYKEAFGDWK